MRAGRRTRDLSRYPPSFRESLNESRRRRRCGVPVGATTSPVIVNERDEKPTIGARDTSAGSANANVQLPLINTDRRDRLSLRIIIKKERKKTSIHDTKTDEIKA